MKIQSAVSDKAKVDGQKKKKDLGWLFLLLLVIGVLLLVFSQNKTPDQRPVDRPTQPYLVGKTPYVDSQTQRVNKHLKETAIQMEKDRLQRMLEVQRELQNYSGSAQQDHYHQENGLTFDSDPNMTALTQELDNSQVLHDSQMTPEELVQKRLYQDQWLQKVDRAYREQYAAEFIENARRAGWAIELGPDFEILSVRKIMKRNRTPTQLFDSGTRGSR